MKKVINIIGVSRIIVVVWPAVALCKIFLLRTATFRCLICKESLLI